MLAQILSSLGSLLLTILCARNLGLSDFGIFSLLFAGYALTIGSIRSLTSEVLLFFHSGELRRGSAAARGATGGNLALASAVSALILIGCAATSAPLAVYLAVVAIPAMAMHDHVRYSLTAVGRPGYAFLSETGGVAVLALVPVWFSLEGDLSRCVSLWIGSEVLVAAVGLILLRSTPTAGTTMSWLRDQWRRGLFYSGDFWATNGLNQAASFIVATVSGVQAAGAIRAAQALLTPVLLLTRGTVVPLGFEGRRAVRRGDLRRPLLISVVFSLSASTLSLVALLAVLFLGEARLSILLGASAQPALSLFPFAVLALVMTGMAMGPGLLLRAIDRVEVALVAKVIALPIGIAGVLTGSLVAGASGALAGLALSEGIRALLSWTQAIRIIREMGAAQ